MAAIERIEIMLVDLPPKVVRTDAIQAFVSQETPIVRDPRRATARSAPATATPSAPAARRSSALLHDHLAPELIGRDAEPIEAIWRRPLLRHPRHRRRARSPRWRWPRSTPRSGTCAAGGRAAAAACWPAARRSGCRSTTTEGGWLQLEPTSWSSEALRRQGARLRPARRSRSASRTSPRTSRGSRRCARRSAPRSRSWSTPTRRSRSTRRSAAPGCFEPLDLAWFEEPLPAEDLGGHVRLAAAPACRSRSASRSTASSTSASTCSAVPARSSRSTSPASAASRRG